MPDLPSRREREVEIAAALLLLFRNQRETGFFLPGAFAHEAAAALREPLAKAYIEAAEQLAREKGITLDPDELDSKAAAWAASQAGFTADRLANRLDMAVMRAKIGSVTADDFQAAIDGVLSDTQAEVLAATQVTAAVTAGEAAVIGLAILMGMALAATWHTVRDGRVCSACEPLDGQPEEVWMLDAPAGPPHHPNCRCWLDYA